MKLSYPLLKLLNIHHEEQPLVLNLMAVQFFQGAGIAFFFTSTFAMFLEQLSVNDLPGVFILAAFFLFISGLVFSILEHRIKIAKLGVYLALLMAGSILLFRIFCESEQTPWFFIFMLSWYYVLYLLNNLSFWGMASVMFDIRQSKRLFGLISSGDIPAKFIGYSLASLLVSYIGTSNLLFAGVLFMLGSIPFLYRISKLKMPDVEKHHTVSTFRYNEIGRLKTVIERFTSNKLIEKSAILALLFSLSLILINFIFYAEIKTAYHEDEALAKFIALFLAGSRIVALLIKLVLTGRLMARLGFKRSLLITPVVLFNFALLILISGYLGSDHRIIFYLFGMLAIAADVLNSAIHLPGFFTLMQPLPSHERLRAHNIVKGVMDPFAYLASGLFLMLLIRFNGHVDIILLTYTLIALLAFWVAGIFRVNRQYMKTLIQSITTRTFNNENISISDKDSLQLISGKLQTGTTLEKIYLLKLLRNCTDLPGMTGLTVVAMKDPGPEIRKEAIHALCQSGGDKALTILRESVTKEQDPSVISVYLEAICKTRFDEELLKIYLNHRDVILQKSAISLILMKKESTLFSDAERRLVLLVTDGDTNEKLLGAEIIGDIKDTAYSKYLAVLINNSDPVVSRKAILSAGKIADEENIRILLNLLYSREEVVIEALGHAGEGAVSQIMNFILSGRCGEIQQQSLLRLCGRIGGNSTAGSLLDMAAKLPGQVPHIVEALRKCRFKAASTQLDRIEALIAQHFDCARQIHELIINLDPGKDKHSLLYRALTIEFDGVREILLDLFSFVYDTVNIDKIRRGLKSGKRNNIAIAIELIEISLASRHVIPFLSLFERQDHHARPAGGNGQDLSHKQWNQMCDVILSRKEIPFNAWTKACCMYSIRHKPMKDHHYLAEPYLQSDILLLRETAQQLVLN